MGTGSVRDTMIVQMIDSQLEHTKGCSRGVDSDMNAQLDQSQGCKYDQSILDTLHPDVCSCHFLMQDVLSKLRDYE